jgi:F0F1-type ATP synthase assembly protein I
MPAEPTEPGGKKVPAESEISPEALGPAKNSSALGLAIGLGGEIAGAVVGGVAVGWWMDRRFDTDPWLTVLGAMLGIIVALYQLIKISSKRGDGR